MGTSERVSQIILSQIIWFRSEPRERVSQIIWFRSEHRERGAQIIWFKQEEENQESSDKETECDSMMLKTFYHTYILFVTWIIQYGFNNPFLFLLNMFCRNSYFSCLYAVSSSKVLHMLLENKVWWIFCKGWCLVHTPFYFVNNTYYHDYFN